MKRKLTAILAADVVGYSRLMGADEEGTFAELKRHRGELVGPKVTEHRGHIVKTTGDGILVEFGSAVDAVRCAIEVQKGMAERNASVPEHRRIEFRVGINLGDVIVDADDIYGEGVNIAARLEGLADPGGICISGKVQAEVRNTLDAGYEFLGRQKVKNIAKPVPVFRVLMEPDAAGRVIDETEPRARRVRWVALASVVLLSAGVAVWQWPWVPPGDVASVEKTALPEKPSIAETAPGRERQTAALVPPTLVPTKVVLMASPIEGVVYDERTFREGGTNADDITQILKDLPVLLVKETINLNWKREEQVRQVDPDLIIIHLSGFYNMTTPSDRLNRFRSFMSYVADTRTKFIVYSRYPEHRLADLLKEMLYARHPSLRGRVHAFGLAEERAPTFRDPVTARDLKQLVKQVLDLQ